MVSTFGFGIACAAPMGVLVLSIASHAECAEPVSVNPTTIDVIVQNARSEHGVIQLSICPNAAGFPACGQKALRTAQSSIEDGTASVRFSNIPAGEYAIAVFHDANDNGKLDTLLGIPKEGFGFSRNPTIGLRAPRFSDAKIDVEGTVKLDIRLRYLL